MLVNNDVLSLLKPPGTQTSLPQIMNPNAYEQLNRREEGQAATPYDTLGWQTQTFKKIMSEREHFLESIA